MRNHGSDRDPVRTALPALLGYSGAKKRMGRLYGGVTDYFRTGAAGVFITTPAFGWSFRYSTLCDPCFNDFMPFDGEETTFAATVPDPDFFGAFS